MRYWNQENFAGLKNVGEKYSSLTGYELFGQYCLFKEQGLKKQANAAITKFIASAKTQSIQIQREIAVELSALNFWNSDIHQLMAYPLKIYLQEVLARWAGKEEADATPHRWLGHIAEDISEFEKALVIDPKDEISLTRLAHWRSIMCNTNERLF